MTFSARVRKFSVMPLAATIFIGAMTASTSAFATDNFHECFTTFYQYPTYPSNWKAISCRPMWFPGNPDDPSEFRIVESADHTKFTIEVISTAAGPFTVQAPCTKLTDDIAECPKTYGTNNIIKKVTVQSLINHTTVYMDIPSFEASVIVGGNASSYNVVEVAQSTKSKVQGGAGNDTFIGGTGVDDFSGGTGTDEFFVDGDGTQDKVTCFNEGTPVDTVHVDATDQVINPSYCVIVP